MQDVMAVILSGGQGQRLYPLTKFRSKPAVPLGGKYRLIDIPVSNCLNSEINQVFVLTQFNSASLNKHIVQTYKFDMFNGGFVDILAAEQTPDNTNWFQGTADAVRQSIKHFMPYDDVRTIIVLSGDQLYQMDLRRVIQFHIDSNAEITVAAVPVSAESAPSLGIMKTQKDGRTIAFKEKPKTEDLADMHSERRSDGRDYLASMGIYVFKKQFLVDLLTKSMAADFGRDLIPQAIHNHRVMAYVFDGYWEDIGSIPSYYRASLQLLKHRLLITDPDWPIFTQGGGLPPARCADGSRVSNSIVADGCVVKGTVTGSILFPGVTVERGAVVRDSIVFPFTRVGAGARVTKAILDKFVRVGEGASIGVRPGPAGTARNAVSPGRQPDAGTDIAVVGRKARILQGVTVSAGALVEPHAIARTRRKR